MPTETEDAFEIERVGADDGPVVLTCEHASERLPPPWTWPKADRRLVGTHWAFDLGAAELTRALARELRTTAVLSRFSRLLVDPNRPENAADLFRPAAEGEPVELNRNVGEGADRHARRHGRKALEIELRQDLAADGAARRRLAHAVRDFFIPP